MNTSIQKEELEKVLLLKRQGLSRDQICQRLNLSLDQVKRRLELARRRERMDPEILGKLENHGLSDLGGLHSGWIMSKDENGSGASLYFKVDGSEDEKLSFAEAIMEVLKDIPKISPIKLKRDVSEAEDYATWLALADLHVGGNYDDPILEEDFNGAIDDLISRLPLATHAVLLELGDLLEMNDHKGETPGSGNRLETKLGPEAYLKTIQIAVKLMRRAIYRLLETHETVEVHFLKGNHDPTAHVAVLLALSEHFSKNSRVDIKVVYEEFRVISWGQCAVFPHHGDTLRWEELKDVFADQFPEEWAKATAHRHIMTAHFHHDRKRDHVGVVCEHFRTLQRPNKWAQSKGMFSRGSLTALTVHKSKGIHYRTVSNVVTEQQP